MARKARDDKETFEVVNGDVHILPGRKPNKPAQLPESREAQLINLAVNLAEQQLRDGTASSAVIVHYLKLATKEEHLKRKILEEQAKLLGAKTDALQSGKNQEQLAINAIEAMKRYTGSNDE